MTQTAEPPAVSRFEYNLLRLARFAVGHMPADQAAPLVYGRLPAPPCLSRTCVRLAADTLAKGAVSALVRAGGWRRDRFLRGAEPAAGRVWDRIPLPERALTFGPPSLGFLVWLTAEKPTDAKETWDVGAAEPSPADELFLALAYDQLRALPDVPPALAARSAFRRNGLCRLLHPGDFADADPAPPAFGKWLTGPRAVFLECLQPLLAQRWVRADRAKGQIEDWKRMRQVGTAEAAALTAFLAAAEEAGRFDLARFVLHANAAVLTADDLGPEFWTGGLKDNRPQRLADRLEAERAALALPQQMATLRGWDRQARAVGFFDESYQASQLWKADWEAAGGDALAARAEAIVSRLDPLRPTA